MFEQSARRSTRLAAYFAILALILTAFMVGCKKSDTGAAGGGGEQAAAGRRARGGAQATAQNAGQPADSSQTTAAGGRGGTRGAQGGRGGAPATTPTATQPAGAGQTAAAGGRGGAGVAAQPTAAPASAGAGGAATDPAEAATARLLAAAVAKSGVKVDPKVQAQAVKEMAPLVQQMGLIGKNDQEALFVQRIAASLKQNQELLAQAASGGLSASGLVLSVNTVAGTEVQKAAKIQKFAALYGPAVWVKETNWDGRLIEWVTFKHERLNVKLPVSLVMDAPKLSVLDGYFWIYNNTGFKKVDSKQTITAPAGLKAKVLAEEKLAAKAAAAAASEAAKAATATTPAGDGAGGRRGRRGGRGGMMGG